MQILFRTRGSFLYPQHFLPLQQISLAVVSLRSAKRFYWLKTNSNGPIQNKSLSTYVKLQIHVCRQTIFFHMSKISYKYKLLKYFCTITNIFLSIHP